MRIIIKNGRLITPIRIIKNGGVVVRDSAIEKVFTDDNVIIGEKDRVIDVGGKFIAPGFIDIHNHGGNGYNFLDGTVEAIIEPARTHMRYGVTSIVPTISTCTLEQIFNVLDCFKKAKSTMKNGPNLLGVHLEGPYFSSEEKGAQDPDLIRKPNKEEYMEILDYSNDIVRWSVAPEVEGAYEMGRLLVKKGILCSAGHTNATYDDMLKAYENGFTHITHLYSGTSSVKRINAFRYSGVVESAYLIDELTVEIIADGRHLPESLLKMIYKIKGSDKIALISDAIGAATLPDGIYKRPDGRDIIVEDDVAKLIDRTSFAGSVATSDRLIKTMINLADVSLQEAVKMITLTPARIMNIENRKGLISEGRDADIVVFDDKINILLVMVMGEITEDRL